MLDPHVLDVYPGGAGRVEEPGELAGLVGDDDLDDGEGPRPPAVLAGDALDPGAAAVEQAGDVTAGGERFGGEQHNFTVVQVVIADQPGELARLFNAAGAAGVNIEDVRIEHSPGLPVGVAELSVRPEQAGTLLDAMRAGGWPVRR